MPENRTYRISLVMQESCQKMIDLIGSIWYAKTMPSQSGRVGGRHATPLRYIYMTI